jgi:hypothetical protein
MTDPDIAFLARFAYDNGTDPIDYAAENVIEGHVKAYLTVLAARVVNPATFPIYDPDLSTAVLSRRILGDLMDAGWTPPEVPR